MLRPEGPPIGLHLARIARLVSRAFDEALVEAGGSLPAWLVLLNLKMRKDANQRQLAEAVGVTEATLTHHLNAMEKDGLLARRRDPANRRNHIIELTPSGDAAFLRLAATARAFDQRLRTDFEPAEISTLGGLLNRLSQNVAGAEAGPPWAGLIEPTGAREGRKGARVSSHPESQT